MQFNYITTESLQKVSGGWSGLNKNIYEGLSKRINIKYIQVPNPPLSKSKSRKSKLKRFFGLKGEYFMLSDSRLFLYKKTYSNLVQSNAKTIFFGSMPWLYVEPETEYYVITDISFKGYYQYYNKHNFLERDIERIAALEKNFFKNASRIFFTSQWALNETQNFYSIGTDNFINIGIAGNIEGTFTSAIHPPEFLYISQDFSKKGGNELFKAFSELYQTKKQIKLNIIGGTPPKVVLQHPGVAYYGFLNKNKPDEKDLYIKLLSSSICLVLPTKSDAAPLTVIECGYFGTPTIAPERFAIPEMVIPNKTGFLISEHYTVSEILEKMKLIINMNQNEIETLRKSTFYHFSINNTWNKIISAIVDKLNA